jgi:hypothetical protein
MLAYVHDTAKIRRIWDFKSGRSGGRAVECSSLIFQRENTYGRSVEEKNAHDRSAVEDKKKKKRIVGFPSRQREAVNLSKTIRTRKVSNRTWKVSSRTRKESNWIREISGKEERKQ